MTTRSGKYIIDVILIGTTGMGAAEEVILGSVANNVIHHARQCLQSADIFRFACCDVPILLEIKPKYLRQKQGGMKNKRNSLSY